MGRKRKPAVGVGKRELKFFDQSYADAQYTTMDFCPFVYTIATSSPIAISQGPGASQRIGRDIDLRSIEVRGSMRYQPSATTTYNPVLARFMIVCDHRPDGTSRPPISQILESTAVPYNSYPNLYYRDRFTIMVDKHYKILSRGQTSAAAGADPLTDIVPLHFTTSIPRRDGHVQYAADAGVTTINVQYYFILLSTEDGVRLNFQSRARFYG